jgi:hypothetical protein
VVVVVVFFPSRDTHTQAIDMKGERESEFEKR